MDAGKGRRARVLARWTKEAALAAREASGGKGRAPDPGPDDVAELIMERAAKSPLSILRGDAFRVTVLGGEFLGWCKRNGVAPDAAAGERYARGLSDEEAQRLYEEDGRDRAVGLYAVPVMATFFRPRPRGGKGGLPEVRLAAGDPLRARAEIRFGAAFGGRACLAGAAMPARELEAARGRILGAARAWLDEGVRVSVGGLGELPGWSGTRVLFLPLAVGRRMPSARITAGEAAEALAVARGAAVPAPEACGEAAGIIAEAMTEAAGRHMAGKGLAGRVECAAGAPLPAAGAARYEALASRLMLAEREEGGQAREGIFFGSY